MHDQREQAATIKTLGTVGQIYMQFDGRVPDLATTDDGKLKTYVIFGAAHARTLTKKFVDYGATPDVIELTAIDESHYLEGKVVTIQRRIGRVGVQYGADLLTKYTKS